MHGALRFSNSHLNRVAFRMIAQQSIGYTRKLSKFSSQNAGNQPEASRKSNTTPTVPTILLRQAPTSGQSPLDLIFDNTEEAFRSKTTSEVLRAYLVFTLCSSTYLVENNMKLMTLAEKVLGKRLFKSLMEATFYGHFVAGENEQSIKPIIQRMRNYGVNAILNYSAEEDVGHAHNNKQSLNGTDGRNIQHAEEEQLDRNVDIFLRCIEAVSSTTQSTGFAAIKLTALGKPPLLLHLSELVTQSRRFLSDKTIPEQNILISGFPERKHNDDGRTMDSLITALSPEEEELAHKMLGRLHKIFSAACDLDVRVMVDAEQTYFQPVISTLAIEMMSKYNKNKAIVFNTYQCYLKQTYSNLLHDLEQADRENFFFGAKLVRGAYLEQERARASALGYEDPTNPNYEATTAMYQKALLECLRRIKELKMKTSERRIAAMVASNNEETVRFAIQKMQEFDISPEDKVICFGQNLGMCDQISFPLGQSGYSVYKYTPFGPVEEVLPYLSRRVHENRGVLAKIKKEKRMLLAELRRRLVPGKPSPLAAKSAFS